MIKKIFKRFIQLSVYSALSLLLWGCATGPTLRTRGGCFHNMTEHPIEKVTLRVLADRREASCSYVGAWGYFSIQLPERTYIEKEIEISWTSRG